MSALKASKVASRWAQKSLRAKLPAPVDLVRKWNVVRGDKVQIMRGKDAGKQGVVKKVLRKKNALIVSGLNLVKKRVPPTAQSKSQLVPQEAPVPYSCVSLVDPQTNAPCRIAWTPHDEGDFNGKLRVSKATGAVITRPALLRTPRKRIKETSSTDTKPDVVERVTFDEDSLIPL